MRKMCLGILLLFTGLSARAQVYAGGEEDGYAAHSFGTLVHTASAQDAPRWEIILDPASGDWLIRTEAAKLPEEIVLLSVEGKELLRIEPCDREQEIRISLEKYTAGAYLWRLRSGDRVLICKFIHTP